MLKRVIRSALVVALMLMAGFSAAQSDERAVGVWRGVYDCNQGRTGLTLEIRRAPASGRLEGLFMFYAVSENPDVPTGCFRMTSAAPAAGAKGPPSKLVRLMGDAWILRPDGYVTVDLDGALSADGQTFEGRVIGYNCSRFELRRDRPATSPEEERCGVGVSIRTPAQTDGDSAALASGRP